MIQGQRFRQTIREERSASRQLIVRQSRMGRFEAGITLGLEAPRDIDDADQADLASSFHPHDQMPRPSAIPDAGSSVRFEAVG
jgi:hypothetical protein